MKRYLCLLTAALALVFAPDFPAEAQSRSNARTPQRETRPSPRQSGGSAARSGSNMQRSAGTAGQNSGSSRQKPQTSRKQPSRNPGISVPESGRVQSSARPAMQVRPGSNNVREHSPAGTPSQPPRQPSASPSRQPGRTGNNVPKAPQNTRPAQRPGTASPGRPANSRPSAGGPGHNYRPPHAGTPRPVPPHRDPHRVPPGRRPPVPHGRPVRFWDPGFHYFGYRVTSLPSRYVRRVFWGIPYFIVDDVYYRYYAGSYYVSRPPFGVVFTPAVSLADAICSFAFYANACYTFSTINENAEMITRQNRIIAENNATIAAQNELIALQNQTIANQNAAIAGNAAATSSSVNAGLAEESSRLADRLGLVQSYASVSEDYYYDDGVFFTKNASGEYVTIVPPAGAIVEKLPEDYRIVTLGGDEYYAVDDTVYRTMVMDGTPYFEVLGQMTGSLAERYRA